MPLRDDVPKLARQARACCRVRRVGRPEFVAKLEHGGIGRYCTWNSPARVLTLLRGAEPRSRCVAGCVRDRRRDGVRLRSTPKRRRPRRRRRSKVAPTGPVVIRRARASLRSSRRRRFASRRSSTSRTIKRTFTGSSRRTIGCSSSRRVRSRSGSTRAASARRRHCLRRSDEDRTDHARGARGVFDALRRRAFARSCARHGRARAPKRRARRPLRGARPQNSSKPRAATHKRWSSRATHAETELRTLAKAWGARDLVVTWKAPTGEVDVGLQGDRESRSFEIREAKRIRITESPLRG